MKKALLSLMPVHAIRFYKLTRKQKQKQAAEARQAQEGNEIA